MINTSFSATSSRFDAFTDELIEGLDGDQAQAVLEGVALLFVEQVVSPPPTGTPVDTGRARAGWARALEALGGSFSAEGSDTRAIANGKRKGGLRRSVGRKKGDMGYVAITNNVNYVQFLEYGSSDQAPDGFIRRALEELRGEIRDEARVDLREQLTQANEAARMAGLTWIGKVLS